MELDKSILPHLGRTMKFLDLYVEEELAKAGIPLTKMQFVYLKIIKTHGGQPQSCLAELTGRDKTTFTRNLNILEKKDLVRRTPSPEDKRNKLVELTPHGEEVISLALPVMAKIIQIIEEELEVSEREVLINTLEKIRKKTARMSHNHYNN